METDVEQNLEEFLQAILDDENQPEAVKENIRDFMNRFSATLQDILDREYPIEDIDVVLGKEMNEEETLFATFVCKGYEIPLGINYWEFVDIIAEHELKLLKEQVVQEDVPSD